MFQALEYITTRKKHDEANAAASAHAHSNRSSKGITGDDDDMKPLDTVIESLCSFF